MDKKIIFIPSEQDKELAKKICFEVIDRLHGFPVGFKAYVMRTLVDGFESSYNVDLGRVKEAG